MRYAKLEVFESRIKNHLHGQKNSALNQSGNIVKISPVKATKIARILLPTLLLAAILVSHDLSAAEARDQRDQTPPQVTVTPAIPGVVAEGTPITFIKDGFDGTEGPLAYEDGSVLFTETRANRIVRIAEDGTVSEFLQQSKGANGLALNAQGDIVAVQTQEPQIAVIYPPAHARVLTKGPAEHALNRPNDLVLDKKGGVYFTDPGPANSPHPAFYYLSPNGKLLTLGHDIPRPNGIQLSPDEQTLYVANTYGEYILAYDVAADGSVGKSRNFAKLTGLKTTETGQSSGADGLAVDNLGRLYVASNDGVQIFSPKGEALGSIALPKPPQNLAFAGKDKKTLYVVGRGAVYKISTLTPGFLGRAK